MAELVERAPDRLGLDRAGVLAGRVQECDDRRPAAQLVHCDRVAVLVLEAEVRGANIRGHAGALEGVGGRLWLLVVAAAAARGEGDGSEREDGYQEEGDQNPRVHCVRSVEGRKWRSVLLCVPNGYAK
jgi:hypothetical protein